MPTPPIRLDEFPQAPTGAIVAGERWRMVTVGFTRAPRSWLAIVFALESLTLPGLAVETLTSPRLAVESLTRPGLAVESLTRPGLAVESLTCPRFTAEGMF